MLLEQTLYDQLNEHVAVTHHVWGALAPATQCLAVQLGNRGKQLRPGANVLPIRLYGSHWCYASPNALWVVPLATAQVPTTPIAFATNVHITPLHNLAVTSAYLHNSGDQDTFFRR